MILRTACDCLILALVTLVGAITLTGGTEFDIATLHVSAHSTGWAIIACAALVLIRCSHDSTSPWLGVLDITGRRNDCFEALRSFWTRFARLRDAQGRRVLRLLFLGSLIAMLVNAWVHYGFFSGDDVEIHEMSLALLFGESWPIWDLRGAFYPIGMIHPVQRLVFALGVTDIGSLVFAGRAVVAVFSALTLVLLYRVASRASGPVVATLATAFLAFNQVRLSFGGTELPRPVSTFFVVAAYAAVQSTSLRAGWLAGSLLGIAAAMRFSEVIFLPVAMMHFAIDRRWRALAACVGAFVLAAGGIQTAADWLYWGRPFASALAALDFTLLQRESSRGFQSPLYYLAQVASWTNPVVLGLAVLATARGRWREGLWAWVPLIALSLLPHKEPRYLIPVVPFVALLAAEAVTRLVLPRHVLQSAHGGRRANLDTLAVTLALAGSLVFGANGFHMRRSERDVDLARRLAREANLSGLAAEQLWRLGGRLYLRSVPRLVDIDPNQVTSADDLETFLRSAEANYLAITPRTCAAIHCRDALQRLGYVPLETYRDVASRYLVFLKVQPVLRRVGASGRMSWSQGHSDTTLRKMQREPPMNATGAREEPGRPGVPRVGCEERQGHAIPAVRGHQEAERRDGNQPDHVSCLHDGPGASRRSWCNRDGPGAIATVRVPSRRCGAIATVRAANAAEPGTVVMVAGPCTVRDAAGPWTLLLFLCAGGGNRTHTGLVSPQDFKCEPGFLRDPYASTT